MAAMGYAPDRAIAENEMGQKAQARLNIPGLGL